MLACVPRITLSIKEIIMGLTTTKESFEHLLKIRDHLLYHPDVILVAKLHEMIDKNSRDNDPEFSKYLMDLMRSMTDNPQKYNKISIFLLFDHMVNISNVNDERVEELMADPTTVCVKSKAFEERERDRKNEH
jgi:hypothetical protein